MTKGFLIKKFTDKKRKKMNTRKFKVKKIAIKKIMALGLSIAMAASATSCKSSEEAEKTTSENTSDNNTDKKTNTSTDQTSISEYGYNTEYLSLPENEIIQPVLFGNTLYYITYTWNNAIEVQSFDLSAPEEIKTYASFQKDGDISQEIAYLHPNEGGGITFIQRSHSYSQSSGNSLELGDIPGDAAVTEEYLVQLNIDLAALGLDFSDISGLNMKEFAELYKGLTDEGDSVSETWGEGSVSLITVDVDGNQVSNLDITANFKNIRPVLAAYDKDGNIYMYNQTMTVSDNHIRVSEYSVLKINLQTGEAEKTVIDYEITSLLTLPSGEIVAVTSDFNTGKAVVKVWDREGKDFSDFDDGLSYQEFSRAYPAYDDCFYYVDGGINTLYLYDLSEKKSEEILKFSDWDISINEMPLISYIDDTHILMYGYSMGNSGNTDISLIRLTKVKASEIVKKKQIILANLYPGAGANDFVADFNKSNSEYRIVMKSYISFTDEDASIEDGIMALTKDLLSGNAPDLIELSGIDLARYAGSGIFEDLYSFINNDEEFKNRNLNKNILKLFEENGALYALPSLYNITALASNKNILGDEPFTLDKAAGVLTSNSGKTIFDNTSRESLLATLFAYNEDYLIDYAAKTCNFTDGTFEKILNLTKEFPDEDTLEKQRNSDEYIPSEQKIKEGSLVFYPLTLGDLHSYQLTDFIFDGSFSVTGYPSVDGDKIAIYSRGSMYAVSSQSQYKQECWEFIKKVFNEEVNNSSLDFPVDNDAFEAYLTEKSTPYTKTDENGNEIEVPEIGGIGAVQFEFYAPSQEMVQAVRSLVDSVNVLLPFYTEGDIYKILQEEAAPFYAGDKTAAEVCTVIQSRINILINEN